VGESHACGEKRGPAGVGRTAEEPGQAANVDLCCVPATHEAQQRLPAVSGSSGRVLVTPLREPEEERPWPGPIVADPDVASTDARQAYVAAATAPPAPLPEQGEAPEAEIACLERHRRVHNQEMVLRAAHRAHRAPCPPRTVPTARSAGTTTACGATCVPHGAPRPTGAAAPPPRGPPPRRGARHGSSDRRCARHGSSDRRCARHGSSDRRCARNGARTMPAGSSNVRPCTPRPPRRPAPAAGSPCSSSPISAHATVSVRLFLRPARRSQRRWSAPRERPSCRPNSAARTALPDV